MSWLFDTNLISETRKPKANAQVLGWVNALNLTQMHTSTVNMAELVFGAESQSDIKRRRDLTSWIEEDVRLWFSGRIHEVTEGVLVRWRLVTREAEVKQLPAPATDLLIAAVAMENNLSVATRDAAPFAAAGVPTFNPFTGERFNGA